LGARPDDRPLYVGKAEASMATRDLRQHFGTGATGYSTVRRTFAALLTEQLGLVPVPRSSNPADAGKRATMYALRPSDEMTLTEWMEANLTIAFHLLPADDVPHTEDQVIKALRPPLCLKQWGPNPWKPRIAAARARMAERVRASYRNEQHRRPSLRRFMPGRLSSRPQGPIRRSSCATSLSMFLMYS
jgi:hypothetical protein